MTIIMSTTTTATSYTLPSKCGDAAWGPTPGKRRAEGSSIGKPDLVTWTADHVAQWLSGLSMGAYEEAFRENDITGDVLVHATHTMLKQLDVHSVGHRLTMLKSIYYMKTSQGVEILPGDYVPQSVTMSIKSVGSSPVSGLSSGSPDQEDYVDTISRLENVVKQQSMVISTLTNDLNNLSIEFSRLKDELAPVWPMVDEYSAHIIKKTKKGLGSKTKDRKEKETSPKEGPKDFKELRTKTKGAGLNSITTTLLNTGSNAISGANGISSSAGVPSNWHSTMNDPNRSASPNSSTSSLPNISSFAPLAQQMGAIRVYYDPDRSKPTMASYKTIPVTNVVTVSELIPTIIAKFKIPEEDSHFYALYTRQKSLPDSLLTPDECPLQVMNDRHQTEDDPLLFVLKSDKNEYTGEQFL